MWNSYVFKIRRKKPSEKRCTICRLCRYLKTLDNWYLTTSLIKRRPPFLQLPARHWRTFGLINDKMQKFKIAIMMPIFSFWKMNFLYLIWFLCRTSFVLWARKVSIPSSNAIGKEVQLEKLLQFLKKRHVSWLFKNEMHIPTKIF